MKVYWLNYGLRVEPENTAEFDALKLLSE